MERQILEQEKDIVIARLMTAPENLRFLDGDKDRSYTRDEMIGLIRTDTSEGLEFVKTEFEFLKALKNGKLLKLLTP